MKFSSTVLTLGALLCTLISPFGAAVWGEPHPLCGCSLDACYCPHGTGLLGEQGHGGHGHNEHGQDEQGHHGSHAHGAHAHDGASRAGDSPDHGETGSLEPASVHSRAAQTGDRCTELRRCGRGSRPGAGTVPALPDGESLPSVALPLPGLSGASSLEASDPPPDVVPAVESPPPRRELSTRTG